MKSINLIKGFLFSIVLFLSLISVYFKESISLANGKKASNNIENTVYMYLEHGTIVIKLLPDVAPKHVERFKTLVKSKFYDGLTFHRVIEGFVAQGGDPTGTGTGGSGIKIPAEFTSKYSHKRGVLSMARAQDIDSADSQFFIVLQDAFFLDNQYTIFGYIVKGMEFVDKIKKSENDPNGMVKNPDKIIKMVLAKDLKK